MKRFIDLANQTGNIDFEAGEREFAFFCTVKNKFEEFNGSQVWDSDMDFIEDYKASELNELDRYLNLIPNEFKKTNLLLS